MFQNDYDSYFKTLLLISTSVCSLGCFFSFFLFMAHIFLVFPIPSKYMQGIVDMLCIDSLDFVVFLLRMLNVMIADS